MRLNHRLEIKVDRNIGIRQNHISFFLVFQEIQNSRQRAYTAHIGLRFFFCKRRENIQTAVLANQIPLTSGTEMVHQRMVIVVHHDGNISDIAVGHAG